jgi:hypothetical protein
MCFFFFVALKNLVVFNKTPSAAFLESSRYMYTGVITNQGSLIPQKNIKQSALLKRGHTTITYVSLKDEGEGHHGAIPSLSRSLSQNPRAQEEDVEMILFP